MKEANGLDEFVNINLVGTALVVLSDDRRSSVGGLKINEGSGVVKRSCFETVVCVEAAFGEVASEVVEACRVLCEVPETNRSS